MSTQAKVLFLDIETSFKIAGVWQRWNVNVSMDQLFQDTYVLCWAAKWLGRKEIKSDALFKHAKAYKADPTSDKEILKTVWKLLDEADYVIAHNGRKFDIPTLNSRFVQIGLKPPSPYTVIDTLDMARRKFKFTSNRLDDLGKALQVGEKNHTSFKLWSDVVLKRDRTAFREMVDYNVQDVVLLEAVYHKLKVWDERHPNTSLSGDHHLICNTCNGSNVRRDGFKVLATGRYQQYKCTDCGHWMRSNKSIKTKKPFVLRGA